MARIAGNQFFRIIHHHLHWLAALQRQEVASGDIHESPLAAEVPANVHRMKHELLLCDSNAIGKLGADCERRLAAGPDFRAAGRVRLHHTGVRL